jgi:hypothetical protein
VDRSISCSMATPTTTPRWWRCTPPCATEPARTASRHESWPPLS